jgi:hypothetical protein
MLSSLLILIYAAGAHAPRPAGLRPEAAEAVLQDISRRGPEAVLRQVYQDDRRWQHVLAGIAGGSREWLEVAERLKRVAREPAEELTVAVARALETEPAHALAILGDAFDADDVCSLNTLEESLGRDYAVALRTVERRREAVARVADPALLKQRDDCLGFLDELRGEVERNRSSWFGPAFERRTVRH